MEFLAKYHTMIITAVIGTFGYCLLFNIKKDKLVYGCIGGAMSITIYCLCAEADIPFLVQNMIPAAVATLYAELMARFVKAPATVFLLPAVIPLAPGGKLYYTMRAIVGKEEQQASILGHQTAEIALGIAIGIVLVSLVFFQLSHKHVRFQIRFESIENTDSKQQETVTK